MASLADRVIAFARDVIAFSGRRGVEATAFVAVGAVLEGAGIILLAPLLTVLFSDPTAGLPGGQWLARLMDTLDPFQGLCVLLAGFGMVMALRAVVLWRRDNLLGRLQVGYVEGQRRAIARRLAASRWETLASLGHARVTHIMGADIQRCGAGVQFLLQGGVAVVMIVVQVVLALALAPTAALLAIGLVALGAVGLGGLFRGARTSGARVTGANLALMTGLGRFLGGMKMAMSQNLQGDFVDAFDRELKTASDHQSAFVGQQSLLRVMWSLVGAAAAAVTLIVGYGVLGLAPAVLIALLVILARIGGPASQLQLGFQQIAYSLSAWETLQTLKADLPAGPGPASATGAGPLAGPVVFDGVGYRHVGGAGLDRLDLRIERGEFVGIAGPSGAGKTTFADLLAGLLQPQTGAIRVGDSLLDAHTAGRWRDQTAYVSQDPFLFNDSIKNNLLWANPDVTNESMRHALAVCGAERMIANLPNGLETPVGELGGLISGGERQRLALARALLRRPDLLILDEATNAIDIEGERAILTALARMEPRPTIVLIAHRRESFGACDRVITFPGPDAGVAPFGRGAIVT